MPNGPATPKPVRIIALINQKGGVGKTTTAVNLTAAVAELGRRVLLIDMDPQAHASLHLGVDGSAEATDTTPDADDDSVDAPGRKPTVYDLLVDPGIDPALTLRKARDNLYVIPAETDLAAAETELAAEPDRLTRLGSAIAHLQNGDEPFEFVFIDCPPSLGVLTLNALAAAREVFIPMQAHFLALQGVGKLLETVQIVSGQINPRLYVTGVILCMHDASTTHTKEVVNDLDAFFENARGQDVPWKAARVYRPAVRRNIKLAECPSFGQSVIEYAAGCPGAADYRELAKTIVGEWDRMLSKRGKGGGETAPVVVTKGAGAANGAEQRA